MKAGRERDYEQRPWSGNQRKMWGGRENYKVTGPYLQIVDQSGRKGASHP